jgi:NADPH-dependent methylglyoxal reductase
VEDVAAIHLKSLDLKVPGNERYLFHIRGLLSGPQLANKIREEYPQLRNRVPKGEEIEGAPENLIKTDISKFEKVFGSNWNDWWESSRGTVEDVLKLTN